MRETAAKNKVKSDIVLKDFWRDNERFADLFNGALFGGEKVLDPETLQEADTDVSSVLKFNGYAETLGRLLDVVKKSVCGVDFVILGLEDQMKVHYAMPLRNMAGDTLSYLKEYAEKVRLNKKAGNWASEAEFLSGLRKGDRLHPVVTLCVYYGETAWDGPVCLTDMLDMQGISGQIKSVINDYKLNLVQVLESDRYSFRNPQVHDFFEIMRNIYRRDYKKIEEVYGSRDISAELGLAIGAAAESKKLMNKALKWKGGMMNMCTALKELENEGRREGRQEGRREGRQEGRREGRQEGRREGRQEGRREGRREGRQEGKIEGIVKTCKEFGASKETAAEKLRKECGLKAEDARRYVIKYYI